LKIEGSHTIPFDQARAYTMLQDPEVLARSMPGCDHMEKIAEDEYQLKMKMAISAVQGLFAGKIRVADKNPPNQFRLIVEGTGKVGFMKGDGLLTLTPAGNSTEVHYEGEVQIGGMIAGVGQRLLESTSKFMIKKFFERLTGAATEQQAPAV
jgi:carbon monoxide dehydrogenase subunit G